MTAHDIMQTEWYQKEKEERLRKLDERVAEFQPKTAHEYLVIMNSVFDEDRIERRHEIITNRMKKQPKGDD